MVLENALSNLTTGLEIVATLSFLSLVVSAATLILVIKDLFD